jgi:hypothetical protein
MKVDEDEDDSFDYLDILATQGAAFILASDLASIISNWQT